MKKYKNIIIFVILFFSFLFLNLFVNQLQNDEIWNYGFTHNIYSGLVPYKDFNMVITPFFPFVMSLVFHVFGSNLLVFHIENCIILVVLSYLMYQLIGEKVFLIGILTLIFSNSITFPSYNLFLLFLFVLLIYLEKKKSNDYFIGFLIGISVLTKQSIGVFFILPSFYYFRDKKKLGKRFVGFLVPCVCFLLFLLINHNFNEFLDLCFFGLFDFGSKNTPSFNFGYIALFLYFLVCGYFIFKDKKNIYNYYALAFSTMMIPLVDVHHSMLAYIGLILVILMKYDFSLKVNLKLIYIVCFVLISIISIYKYNEGYPMIYPNDIKHFEYRFIHSDSLDFTHQVLDYMDSHKGRDFVFMTSGAYYYRLITDTPITYLDLTNNGNYGYQGSEKIIKDIKKHHDAIFFVFEEELGNYCQSDKPSMQYVIDHGNKIGQIMIYTIYELE